jgi:hypothetical protein
LNDIALFLRWVESLPKMGRLGWVKELNDPKGSSKNYFPFFGIENKWFYCFMVSLL